jgi:hypothetical protein
MDQAISSKRRLWPRLLALFVVAVLVAAWLIRNATWPCGVLDRTSGCISSVTLDVEALGFDPGVADVFDARSFDVAPGAALALVSLGGKADEGVRSALALFDTKTGKVKHVLHNHLAASTYGPEPAIREAAFSPDGSLAAALQVTIENAEPAVRLVVYDVAGGSVRATLIDAVGSDETDGLDCTGMFDFNADGRLLQCGSRLFALADGSWTSLVKDDDYQFPIPAEFMGEWAPDGTDRDDLDLPSALLLQDVVDLWTFAPDSAGLIELQRSWARDRRWPIRPFYIADFWQMSGVAIWDAKARMLTRSFYSNQRYVALSWSRDAQHFGFIDDDLRLEIFTR